MNASWTTRIQIKTSENISSLTFESNSRPCYDFLDKSSTVLQSAVLHPLMGKTIWFLKNICCTIHCTLLCADKFSSGKNSLTHLFMRQSETQSEYCCHKKPDSERHGHGPYSRRQTCEYFEQFLIRCKLSRSKDLISTIKVLYTSPHPDLIAT